MAWLVLLLFSFFFFNLTQARVVSKETSLWDIFIISDGSEGAQPIVGGTIPEQVAWVL